MQNHALQSNSELHDKGVIYGFDLRRYQIDGVNFFSNRKVALLADEMGLGKTVQTIISCQLLHKEKVVQSILIIAPTSLCLNWKKECDTWGGHLKAKRVIGNTEDRKAILMLPCHIWIMSYEQVRNEIDFIYNRCHFDLVILDEAQKIKNKDSRVSLACRHIPRDSSWALTGTPIENHVEDICSIFSFLKKDMINEHMNLETIQDIIQPFFLRRTKDEVLGDLPPIIEKKIYLEMTGIQKIDYDDTFTEGRRNLTQSSGKMSNTSLFAQITKLKQICNFSEKKEDSCKYNAVKDLFDEFSSNKKVIIFSQYVETLNVLQNKIQNDFPDFEVNIFDGQLSQESRNSLVEDFETKSKTTKILLCSLKAAGVGLNLNSGEIVIMYDRWWNPAVENQAIQRAHRFGKTFPLNVIKFIVVDSIEERINNLIDKKTNLFHDLVDPLSTNQLEKFTRNDLLNLLNIY
jgi:SNF2 family DNA or RNA helicase